MTTQPPEGFEGLFAPTYVDYAHADTVGTLEQPDLSLVHRVHLISMPTPDTVTVCESAEGWRFLPGGRLEPGESIDAAIERELAEEAGTVPTGPVNFVFSHIATSRRERPYRPHVPHPVMWWTYGVCSSRIVGPPQAPPGTEQITAVHHLPVDEAISWLAGDPGAGHSEVVRLAACLGLI